MKNINIHKSFPKKGNPISDAENLSGSLKKYTDKYVNIKTVRKEISFEIMRNFANKDIKL